MLLATWKSVVRSHINQSQNNKKMYTINDLPTGKAIINLAEGIYIKKVKDGYIAGKNAPNMSFFIKSIKYIGKEDKESLSFQNAQKFDDSESLLNFLNDMSKPKKFNKNKHLQKSLNALPADQKQAIIQGIMEQPTLKIGVQKSMTLGFTDLPLFGGLEDRQQKLF
ncbi:hypothetical protein [Emticicia sp. W12TSBA100-4]|uniref:hypothetical protein n=1 Tax=Emticicia sp. W12TSBA100-4 TaxID=3160965 RepID=UPI0033065984